MATNTLFSDIKEVSLTTKDLYPASQPFIGQVVIKIPEDGIGIGPVIDRKKYTEIVTKSPVLETRPQHLLYFEHINLSEGVGNFKLTILDTTWQLENRIVDARGVLGFKYGYSQSDKLSPLYVGKVTSYTIDFKMNGVIIGLTGFTIGFEHALPKQFKSYIGKNIDEIVKGIAIEAKYEEDHICIEPTKPVNSRNSLDITALEVMDFHQTGESNLDFIEKLRQYAVNTKNVGAYIFKTDTGNDGKGELHFHTKEYKCISQKSSNTVRGFTLFKDPNSAVIDFKPNWSMTAANFAGTGGLFQSIVDINSKEVISTSLNLDTRPQPYDGNSPNTTTDKPSELTEANADNTDPMFQSPKFIARGQDQIDSQLSAEFSKRAMGAVQGQLEIHGTHKIRFFEKIAVLVYVPGDSGFGFNKQITHWVSGYYRVIGITNVITKGSYRTFLKLVTAGRLIAKDKVKEAS